MLGPLEVREGTTRLRLGGPRQRSLLAVLLLHANEVVSADRLAEEVWGAAPPDGGALHALVSRLRKVLEPDRGDAEPGTLVTRAPGYVLRLEPEQLDLLRFERLVAEGRAARSRGDVEGERRLLRAALGQWRGRPLADLEDEPFHRDAVRRLDDAWLDAVEARVDADLACGAHAELVAELRALVRGHPFRERLRGQLMLALYRAGDQPAALGVFDEGRRVLADEVGLEPGRALRDLQSRILAQDPGLDGPAPRGGPGPPDPLRRAARGRRLAGTAAVAAALVAALLAVGGSAGGGGDDGRTTTTAGGSVALLDARAARIRTRLPVGTTPAAVATGEGAVWVVDADDQTISRIGAGNEVTTFATGATPTDVAVGAGSVWVGSGERLVRAQGAGPRVTGVTRVDPGTRTVRARIPLPRPARALTHAADGHLAFGAGALWAIAPDGGVARIDPRTDRVTAVARGIQAQAVAAAGDDVWALAADGTLARIDPRRGRIAQRARIAASSVSSLAVGGGAAWVTAPGDGTLWRAQPGPRIVMRTVEVGTGVADVAAGGGAVWVANPLRGEVLRVDPRRNAVTARVALGGTPRSLAAAPGAVWVASTRGPEPSARAPGGGLPRSRCGPLTTGPGTPDRLLVADLPLQGGLRLSVQQMEQAMLFVLRERGFRAGRFAVGFQACDDSVARTGLFDEAKCRGNARAYARAPEVVGVLGLVNTPCALAAVPELNRAPGGPLPAVSALASYPGLTRRVAGAPPGELAALYPTGTRSFLRVRPPDDREAAALAALAAHDGARRVAVLDDGDLRYGGMLAARFAREARRRGLAVVARRSWDPQAPSYAALAGRVARSRPGAVFLGGLLDARGADVVRALRARLGPGVALLAPTGFTPTPLFAARAGAAAEGAYVSLPELVPASLGPAGRRFVERFGVTQPGVEVEPSAVYAAESMAVVLDALARSDGSRASVLRELFATRRRDALLGDLAFDRDGDPVAAPVTVFRIERGARVLPGFDDAVLDRVLR